MGSTSGPVWGSVGYIPYEWCVMSGCLLVVKIGGSEGIDLDACCANIAEVWTGGQRLVLVHGGSGETNRISEQLGHPPRFVTSVSGVESRYTDRETRDIFAMVYAGKVQTGIVERLQGRG